MSSASATASPVRERNRTDGWTGGARACHTPGPLNDVPHPPLAHARSYEACLAVPPPCVATSVSEWTLQPRGKPEPQPNFHIPLLFAARVLSGCGRPEAWAEVRLRTQT